VDLTVPARFPKENQDGKQVLEEIYSNPGEIPRHHSLISRKSCQDQNSEVKPSCLQKLSFLKIEEVHPFRPFNFSKDTNSIIRRQKM
jgi:hypothetical protein